MKKITYLISAWGSLICAYQVESRFLGGILIIFSIINAVGFMVTDYE